MSRHRFWRRTVRSATGVPLIFCATFLAYARLGTDTFFSQHWKYAEPVVEKRRSALGFGPPSLSANELWCLRAWTDAVSRLSPLSTECFVPNFMLHGTLCFLCGTGEWADMMRALSHLPIANVSPYFMEIRREKQGDIVFLHCKVETEITLRIPFGVGWKCVLPSVVSLQLEPVASRWFSLRRQYRIAAAEHRWFGGPLASFQSSSLRSMWGDIGDIVRRFNGYAVSQAVCAVDNVSSHFSDLFITHT